MFSFEKQFFNHCFSELKTSTMTAFGKKSLNILGKINAFSLGASVQFCAHFYQQSRLINKKFPCLNKD